MCVASVRLSDVGPWHHARSFSKPVHSCSSDQPASQPSRFTRALCKEGSLPPTSLHISRSVPPCLQASLFPLLSMSRTHTCLQASLCPSSNASLLDGSGMRASRRATLPPNPQLHSTPVGRSPSSTSSLRSSRHRAPCGRRWPS